MTKPQLLQTIETTKPATFSCIVGIAAAYERLWDVLDDNPCREKWVKRSESNSNTEENASTRASEVEC